MLQVLPGPHQTLLHGVLALHHGPQLGCIVPHHQVLHLNIINPGGGPDDGPPDHGGEYVIRKVRPSIPTIQ